MKIPNQWIVWSYVMLPAISFLLLPHLAMAIAKAQMEKTKVLANALHNRAKIAADLAKYRRHTNVPHFLHNNNAGHNLLNLRPRRKIAGQDKVPINETKTGDTIVSGPNTFSIGPKPSEDKDSEIISFALIQSNDDKNEEAINSKRAPAIQQDDGNINAIWDMNGFGNVKSNDNVIRQAPSQENNQNKIHQHTGEMVGCAKGTENNYMNPYAYVERAAENLVDITRKLKPNDLQESDADMKKSDKSNQSDSEVLGMSSNTPTFDQAKLASPNPNPNPNPSLNSGFSHTHTTTHFINLNNKSPRPISSSPPITPTPTGSYSVPIQFVPISNRPEQLLNVPVNNQINPNTQSHTNPQIGPVPVTTLIEIPPQYQSLFNTQSSHQPPRPNTYGNTNDQTFTPIATVPIVPNMPDNQHQQPSGFGTIPTQNNFANSHSHVQPNPVGQHAAALSQSSSINGNGNIVLQKEIVGGPNAVENLGAFQWVPKITIGSPRSKREISNEKLVSATHRPDDSFSSYDELCNKEQKWRKHMDDSVGSYNPIADFKGDFDKSYLKMNQGYDIGMEKKNWQEEQFAVTQKPNMSPLNLAQDIIKIVDNSVANKGNLGGGILGKIHKDEKVTMLEDDGINENSSESTKPKLIEEPGLNGDKDTDSLNIMARFNNERISNGEPDWQKAKQMTIESSTAATIVSENDNAHGGKSVSSELHHDLNGMTQQEYKAYQILLKSDIPASTAYKAMKYIHKINEAAKSNADFANEMKMNKENPAFILDHMSETFTAMPHVEFNEKKLQSDQMVSVPNPISLENKDQYHDDSMLREETPFKGESIIARKNSVAENANEINKQVPLVHFDTKENVENTTIDVKIDVTTPSDIAASQKLQDVINEVAVKKEPKTNLNQITNVPDVPNKMEDSTPVTFDSLIDSVNGTPVYTRTQLRRAMQYIVGLEKDIKPLPVEEKINFIKRERLLVTTLIDETSQLYEDHTEDDEPLMADSSDAIPIAEKREFRLSEKKRSIRSTHTDKIILQYST